MIRKLSDGRVLQMGQKKGNADEKLGYVLKNNAWKLVYTGNFDGLKKWLDHQITLASKAETRKMIADMCGTSYKAACEDMGLSKI